jgi:hypothetical protein
MTDTIYKNVRYREDIKDLFTSYELDWPVLEAASVNNDYVALANDKGQVIFLRLPHLFCESKLSLFDQDNEDKGRIVDMALLSDPDRLVVNISFDAIKMIDIHSHKLLSKITRPAYWWNFSDDYFVSFIRHGKFGKYIANCNPLNGLLVIDIEKFDILKSVRYSNTLVGPVAFLDDETILFQTKPARYANLPCCSTTMIWDFVNNRLKRVRSLCNYDMHGVRVVNDGSYLYAKTNTITVTKFRRTKDNRFFRRGSLYTMYYCKLFWFHIIDDCCLAICKHESSDLHYFVVLDNETFDIISGAGLFHPVIKAAYLTPDERMLVIVSKDNGKFLVKAVDVRLLIETVIGSS